MSYAQPCTQSKKSERLKSFAPHGIDTHVPVPASADITSNCIGLVSSFEQTWVCHFHWFRWHLATRDMIGRSLEVVAWFF